MQIHASRKYIVKFYFARRRVNYLVTKWIY